MRSNTRGADFCQSQLMRCLMNRGSTTFLWTDQSDGRLHDSVRYNIVSRASICTPHNGCRDGQRTFYLFSIVRSVTFILVDLITTWSIDKNRYNMMFDSRALQTLFVAELIGWQASHLQFLFLSCSLLSLSCVLSSHLPCSLDTQRWAQLAEYGTV